MIVLKAGLYAFPSDSLKVEIHGRFHAPGCNRNRVALGVCLPKRSVGRRHLTVSLNCTIRGRVSHVALRLPRGDHPVICGFGYGRNIWWKP